MTQKRSFLVGMLLVLTMMASAQVGERRRMLTVGVNGGYMMNQVSFTPTIKQGWKGGLGAGVTVRYTCEKYFAAICAVQGEINYANLGWQEVIETSEDRYKRDMHYIQIPILCRLAWGREMRGAQFFLNLGPQIGYCIGEKEYKEGPWTSQNLALRPNHVVEQYGKSVETRFDYGITAGLGVEFATKIGRFNLEGRYYFALSSIFNDGKADPFSRSANGTIVIKAAYLFDVLNKN